MAGTCEPIQRFSCSCDFAERLAATGHDGRFFCRSGRYVLADPAFVPFMRSGFQQPAMTVIF
jgi:hypothetical protein